MSEEAKHTPGPWQLLPEEDDKNYLRIRGNAIGKFWKIANVHYRQYADPEWHELEKDERLANARLIAAAPELLKELQDVDRLLERLGFMENAPWRSSVRAKIAKATGKEGV